MRARLVGQPCTLLPKISCPVTSSARPTAPARPGMDRPSLGARHAGKSDNQQQQGERQEQQPPTDGVQARAAQQSDRPCYDCQCENIAAQPDRLQHGIGNPRAAQPHKIFDRRIGQRIPGRIGWRIGHQRQEKSAGQHRQHNPACPPPATLQQSLHLGRQESLSRFPSGPGVGQRAGWLFLQPTGRGFALAGKRWRLAPWLLPVSPIRGRRSAPAGDLSCQFRAGRLHPDCNDARRICFSSLKYTTICSK